MWSGPVPIRVLSEFQTLTSFCFCFVSLARPTKSNNCSQLAGIVGKYIEYPFDTVKVRLQSQPDQFTGPLDCFRQAIRADGVLGGLYRGISAPLVGAALENSSLFFFERIGRDIALASGVWRTDKGELPLAALFVTGAWAGTWTSLVLTPVELVKCRIQAPTVSKLATPTPLSPAAVIRSIYRTEGLLAFWHGQLGTLIREGGGGAAWFGAKETVSKAFAARNARLSGHDEAAPAPLPLWQQAVAGAAGGVMYNFLFFPADTIKSRMQTGEMGTGVGAAAKKRFWAEGRAIWTRYGVKGLYRGCGITCLRSAPSSACVFIIYDGLKQTMDQSLSS